MAEKHPHKAVYEKSDALEDCLIQALDGVNITIIMKLL